MCSIIGAFFIGDLYSNSLKLMAKLKPFQEKHSLSFLILCFRMSLSWEKAQSMVAMEMGFLFTNPKKILLFPGLVRYNNN